MTSIELTAPAKVNLVLKVLSKRKDGYHNLLTLFERISLSDKIKISKIPEGISLSSDKFITKDPKANLLYKAASVVIDRYHIKGGVAINIKKRIPIGAGLGGGSSDAAAVLIGMNKLFGLKLDKDELIGLGRELGADVPFFLFDVPFAIGTSIGDRLEEVKLKKKMWHLIIYPGFEVLTKDIYEEFDRIMSRRRAKNAYADLGLTRYRPNDKIQLHLAGKIKFDDLESMLHNDLQEIVVVKVKTIGSIIKRLAYFLDKKVVVSGSGPSVFCLCQTRKEAISLKEKLSGSLPSAELKKWQLFIAETED